MLPIIVVFGATGNQGGSVLKALSATGKYQVKAITRNANSEKAKELAKLSNVTVAEADLEDKASLDRVFAGAYGAFGVTDFSAHIDGKEVGQGVRFIDSAVQNKVQHVIFSCLEDVKSVINKPCLHFDYKYEIEVYGMKKASQQFKFTSIRMPMFYQAYIDVLHKVAPDTYLFGVPMQNQDVAFPIMNVADIGACATTAFLHPEEYKSKVLPLARDKLSVKQVADIFKKHLAPANIILKSGEENIAHFKTMAFPGKDDILAMFEYYSTGKMSRDIPLTQRLYAGGLSFNDYVAKNKESILKQINK